MRLRIAGIASVQLLLFVLIFANSSCEPTKSASPSQIGELSPIDSIINHRAELLLSNYSPFDIDEYSLPEFPDSIDPSFDDVTRILGENCIFCHKPNGNAPFSLMDYNEIKKRNKTIQSVLRSKQMPPWMADNSYSSFFNAPKISDFERSLIIRWIDQGMLPSKDHHKTLIPRNEPLLTPVDLVLKRKTDYTIASNGDSYECFIYEIDSEEEFYLSGIEFKSNNPEVIHHQMLFLDTGNVVSSTKSCWDCKNDGIITKCLPITSWSKGMRPYQLNEKLAFKIPKGSKFILQTHYGDEGNKGRTENTELRLFKSVAYQSIVEYQILNKLDIFYPKGKVITETLTTTLTEKTSILGFTPHAHFLTKKMEIYAIKPDKSIVQLGKIPAWDYLWQGDFIYKTPVILPKGTVIVFTVVIDNTESNPTQPNHPIRDIAYGTNSSDEMLCLVILKKPFEASDLNLPIAHFLY